MVTAKPVDTREPKITRQEILFLQDENFNSFFFRMKILTAKMFVWLAVPAPGLGGPRPLLRLPII